MCVVTTNSARQVEKRAAISITSFAGGRAVGAFYFGDDVTIITDFSAEDKAISTNGGARFVDTLPAVLNGANG